MFRLTKDIGGQNILATDLSATKNVSPNKTYWLQNISVKKLVAYKTNQQTERIGGYQF
jgi:hypothetical protein